MKSTLAILALVVVLIAAVSLFRNTGTDAEPRTPSERPALDLSEDFRELIARGPIASNALRARFEQADPDGLGADLIALLPAADEAWNVEVGALVQDPGPDPAPAAAIVEPRGLRTRGRGRMLVRRPLPGRLEMRVARLDGGVDSEVAFEIPIGRWEWFPDELVLEPGARYSFTALANGEEVVATAFVSTLSEAAEDDYRRKMTLLKRTIADARVRLYMQAVVAMSGGLFSEATEILTQRLPPLGPAADSELGIHRRLAWLWHRRGRLDRRDEALDKLR